MHNAAIAEWILSHVIDPERAEELIGDHLEANPHVGIAELSLFVSWQVIAFSWRMILGVACGGFAGVWAWMPLDLVWQRFNNTPPSQTMVWFLGLSMLLWCMVAFSLVRFGVRSKLFHLSSVAALLASSAATLLQRSSGRSLLLLATIALLGSYLKTQEKREVLLTFIISIAGAWVTGFFILQLQDAVHSQSKWPLILGVMVIPLVEGLFVVYLCRLFCRARTLKMTRLAIR